MEARAEARAEARVEARVEAREEARQEAREEPREEPKAASKTGRPSAMKTTSPTAEEGFASGQRAKKAHLHEAKAEVLHLSPQRTSECAAHVNAREEAAGKEAVRVARDVHAGDASAQHTKEQWGSSMAAAGIDAVALQNDASASALLTSPREAVPHAWSSPPGEVGALAAYTRREREKFEALSKVHRQSMQHLMSSMYQLSPTTSASPGSVFSSVIPSPASRASQQPSHLQPAAHTNTRACRGQPSFDGPGGSMRGRLDEVQRHFEAHRIRVSRRLGPSACGAPT